MVKEQSERLSRTFYALSDPTRRDLLRRIASEDLTVGELGQAYAISGPAISKHLKALESAQLIRRIKQGPRHRFALDTQPLTEAQAVLDELSRFWLRRLTHLETFLVQQTQPKETK